jgi:Putative prokaryotic signal transducing protein
MVGQAVKSAQSCIHPASVSVEDMKELLRTNDPVRLSWAQAMLADAGIESLILDQHTSMVEGSIGAIQRRLMVADGNYRRAHALITATGDAGL